MGFTARIDHNQKALHRTARGDAVSELVSLGRLDGWRSWRLNLKIGLSSDRTCISRCGLFEKGSKQNHQRVISGFWNVLVSCKSPIQSKYFTSITASRPY